MLALKESKRLKPNKYKKDIPNSFSEPSFYYILKYKDIDLIKFTIESHKTRTGIFTNIFWKNKTYNNLYPFKDMTNDGLYEWLSLRGYDNRRSSLVNYYNTVFFTIKLLVNTYGISMIDNYWISTSTENKQYKNIIPYKLNFENKYIEDLFILEKEPPISVKTIPHPNIATNGMVSKTWICEEDAYYLLKSSYLGYEPYSEYYASEIAKCMGLKHVDYWLDTYESVLVSKCKSFTTEDISYYPATSFDEYSIDWLVRTKKITIPNGCDEWDDMCIFDALILNFDRHLGNVGVLKDSDTGNIISLSPIFDNGECLLPNLTDEEWCDTDVVKTTISKIKPASAPSFDALVKHHLKPRHKDMLKKVTTLHISRVSNGIQLPENRTKAIEDFVKNRALDFLNMLD